MRQPCEDSSSTKEDQDAGGGSAYPGHIKTSCLGSGSPSSQMMDRQRRRGVIEKRRRDRINNSLSELRRLVPTAADKQASAKMNKAELLQMTVDHLKVLQAGCWDVHTLSLDFLSLGFWECVMEVSRHLSAVEGLDACDPLQTHILTHLTSVAMAMPSHRPHHPSHLHSQSWALVRPLYGLNALSLPPGASGAPQRPVELLQCSSAVASTSSSSAFCPPPSSLPHPPPAADLTYSGGWRLEPSDHPSAPAPSNYPDDGGRQGFVS